MYHPLAMDQIRVQQEQLRRHAATTRWQAETIESPQRRGRRLRLRSLRLAFPGPAKPCTDC
jgi:hypothetical protein